MTFPKDFVWGVATASYQIEGAVNEDGRGECIWTRFSHTPGKVKNNDNGDMACDHYHRYTDDVKLMQALGMQGYRFSVSWARVLPDGIGTPNETGLNFYDRLVDALLEANITPYVTLYHWDLPQALQDKGGWANRDSIQWFADYTALMTERLGDRVKHWITLNEPWVIALNGYLWGTHAPGIQDFGTAYTVAHHLLLAHGAVVPVIRARVDDAQVGITLNLIVTDPISSDEADVQAARRWESFFNSWFLDPLYHGHYPADILAYFGGNLSDIDFDEVKAAAVPTDFLGVNYYTRSIVGHDENGPLLQVRHAQNPNAQYTNMDWEVYPEGLTRLLVHLQEDYKPGPIYITENGCAFDDPAPVNGVVEDPHRVAYFAGHWAAIEAAIARGVNVAGYFAWSLMDNFEWAEGYSKRFGIVYTDYETQERVPKRSALAYQTFIRANKNNV